MKSSYFAVLGLIALSSNSFAVSNNATQYIGSHLIASMSLGPVWGNGNSAQTLNLGNGIEKTYTVNRRTNTILDGEIFAGVQQALSHALLGQIGIAVAATDYTYLSGNIWDDANPLFNNYNYQYQLNHTHVALKGKLLLDRGYPVMPWVSLSLGVGFNHASSFTNTPTISEAVASPNFNSYTTTAFTYAIGIGAQRQINRHWQVGAGYEFSDWGRSQLSAATGQNSSSAPSLSHYYTSGIMFNATFNA